MDGKYAENWNVVLLMKSNWLSIKFVKELPQWIISSDKAAYHPASNTIYIRQDMWWLIFHELGHWIIYKFLGDHWFHKWLDSK